MVGAHKMGMIKVKENYLLDKMGKPVGVSIDIKEYRKLIKQAEELEAIRRYDEAKASGDQVIPFEQAVEEIEKKRQ